MKRLHKRILTVCLALMMSVVMAVPAFALVTNTYALIYAWNGQAINGRKAALTSNGYNSRVQVQTSNAGNRQNWIITTAPNGNYYVKNLADGYYLNIYRVAYPATSNLVYYYATSYAYENATNGRDQRVTLPTYAGSATCIQLADPIMGTSGSVSGKWYLLTDRTSPSDSSDVIWYGDNSMSKAHWSN